MRPDCESRCREEPCRLIWAWLLRHSAVLPVDRRNWALLRIPAYRQRGFEALIDTRTRRESRSSVDCRHVVQAAREANPRVTIAQVLAIFAQAGSKATAIGGAGRLTGATRAPDPRCTDQPPVARVRGFERFRADPRQIRHHHFARRARKSRDVCRVSSVSRDKDQRDDTESR